MNAVKIVLVSMLIFSVTSNGEQAGGVGDSTSFTDKNLKKHKGTVKAIESGYVVLDTGKGIERIPRLFLPDEINTRFAGGVKSNTTTKFSARVPYNAQEINEIQFSGKVSNVKGNSALGWGQRLRYSGSLDPIQARLYTQRVKNGTEGSPLVTSTVPVMIVGIEDGMVDGAACNGSLFSAGTCPYTNADGETITIKRYATSRELAEKLVAQTKADKSR